MKGTADNDKSLVIRAIFPEAFDEWVKRCDNYERLVQVTPKLSYEKTYPGQWNDTLQNS